MLWGDNDLDKGIAIGSAASTMMPYIVKFLGKVLVAAILSIATAAGKELFAEYVRRNFKGRGRSRDNG